MSILALALAAAAPVPTSPDSRSLEVLRDFGRCVVDANPARSAEILAMDFRTTAYRNALRDYAGNRVACLPNRSMMRSQQTLVAGAMAEALLANQTRRPLEAALARGPATPPIVARSESEATSLCVVMADPAETAHLIATTPTSPDERTTIGRLAAEMSNCLAAKQTMTVNRPGLRALLALAGLRIATANGAVAVKP